jgi:hypothetical protein
VSSLYIRVSIILSFLLYSRKIGITFSSRLHFSSTVRRLASPCIWCRRSRCGDSPRG